MYCRLSFPTKSLTPGLRNLLRSLEKFSVVSFSKIAYKIKKSPRSLLSSFHPPLLKDNDFISGEKQIKKKKEEKENLGKRLNKEKRKGKKSKEEKKKSKNKEKRKGKQRKGEEKLNKEE